MSDSFDFRSAAIEHLVGQPVVALVKANHMMATEQVKLLMDICFSRSGDVYEPIMITMSISRGEVERNGTASVSEVTTFFQIPLITLISINSLAIEDAKIKFDMDVHSYHETLKEEDQAPLYDFFPTPSKSYELAGSIKKGSRGYVKDLDSSQAEAASVSIDVSACQLPLPLGINTIVQAYSKAIHPSELFDVQTKD